MRTPIEIKGYRVDYDETDGRVTINGDRVCDKWAHLTLPEVYGICAKAPYVTPDRIHDAFSEERAERNPAQTTEDRI